MPWPPSHPRGAGCSLREKVASLHAAGASVQEMGAAPERRTAAPARRIGAPGRRNSVPAPNGGATIRRREAPATASDAPACWNSAPVASSAAPEGNGGGVFRGKGPVSSQKAAPGGKISRVERGNEFIAGIGCDAADWSTALARCVSPASRTPVPDAEIRRTASPGDREPGLIVSKSPPLPVFTPRLPSAPRTPSTSSPPHAPQSFSHMQRWNGFSAFDTADHVARDTALHPQRMHAQATGFTEFLQAAR